MWGTGEKGLSGLGYQPCQYLISQASNPQSHDSVNVCGKHCLASAALQPPWQTEADDKGENGDVIITWLKNGTASSLLSCVLGATDTSGQLMPLTHQFISISRILPMVWL